MSHDLKALSRKWFEVAWNQRNLAIIDELVNPKVIVHGLSADGTPQQDISGFRAFHKVFIATFPDLKMIVDDVLQDGDQTAVRIRFNGTHQGGDLGPTPTGKKVGCSGIVIMRWRDGKIVESWNEFDAAGLISQLTGASPKQTTLRP